MNKYVILHVEGGIGKNVIATSVIRAINKKYTDRKIIVLTAYPDVYFLNTRVHKVFQFGQISYFYQDYIKDCDSIIMSQDPYRETDYVYRTKHLSEIWCDMYNIEWDGEKPELYFTHLENEFLQTIIKKDKPIFLINAFGGAQNHQHKYSWARDIPPILAQEIVDEAINHYRVIQVRREDQIALKNCEYLSLNIRQLALALIHSDKRLLIDSYLQHAAASLDLPSVVLWSCNSPKVFGYQIHNNIQSQFDDISGDPMQLTTKQTELFDKNEIMEALDLNIKNIFSNFK